MLAPFQALSIRLMALYASMAGLWPKVWAPCCWVCAAPATTMAAGPVLGEMQVGTPAAGEAPMTPGQTSNSGARIEESTAPMVRNAACLSDSA
jgi:hypothetical protein